MDWSWVLVVYTNSERCTNFWEGLQVWAFDCEQRVSWWMCGRDAGNKEIDSHGVWGTYLIVKLLLNLQTYIIGLGGQSAIDLQITQRDKHLLTFFIVLFQHGNNSNVFRKFFFVFSQQKGVQKIFQFLYLGIFCEKVFFLDINYSFRGEGEFLVLKLILLYVLGEA